MENEGDGGESGDWGGMGGCAFFGGRGNRIRRRAGTEPRPYAVIGVWYGDEGSVVGGILPSVDGGDGGTDCRVASLLAMTVPPWPQSGPGGSDALIGGCS